MTRVISFLYYNYELAKKDDADIIRVVEKNGDTTILIIPDGGIGDLKLEPDDVVISADTSTETPQKELRHGAIIRSKDSS